MKIAFARVSEFRQGLKSKLCSLSYLTKLPARESANFSSHSFPIWIIKSLWRGDECDRKQTTVSDVKNADSCKDMALPNLLGKFDLQGKQEVENTQVSFGWSPS